MFKGKSKKSKRSKQQYEAPVRAPIAKAAKAEQAKKAEAKKGTAWERQDIRAGRITNDTLQRGRTRSLYSCRTRAQGVALADGKFRSPWDLRCLMLMGMKPEKVPALQV
jgi:hypothetical protein